MLKNPVNASCLFLMKLKKIASDTNDMLSMHNGQSNPPSQTNLRCFFKVDQ